MTNQQKFNQRINFNQLSFEIPKHSIRVGKFLIPIHIHIKNIYIGNKSEEVELEFMNDEMSFEFERLKIIEYQKRNFIHINVADKIYNNFNQNFLEYHNLESIDELLFFFDEYDLKTINDHIDKYLTYMIKEFRDRLYNTLKIDDKPPKVGYKPETEMPKNIKDYLTYTEGYILSQSNLEFGNGVPFFEENIGKSYNEYSFREKEIILAYLTMKNRTESISSEYQAKVSQDMKKER